MQRRLQAYLDKLAVEAPTRGAGLARGTYHHRVIAVTKRFWKGLFACYDVDGLPANNNEMESFFRTLKWHYRRVQGKKSTAGGVLESIAPFIVRLRPELHRKPDLSAMVEHLSEAEISRARKTIEELAEPARARRSFIRDPDEHLDAAFDSWLEAAGSI